MRTEPVILKFVLKNKTKNYYHNNDVGKVHYINNVQHGNFFFFYRL